MKPVRAFLTGAVLALALLVAGATGARAQALYLTVFSGTTQLPREVEWQGKTLPAGEYALYYGTRPGGTHYVEIEGKTQGTPHLFITPKAYGPSSSVQNELVCVRDGKRLVVLELQMCGIGESLAFAMSNGAQRTGGGTTSQAGAATAPIQRVPVTARGK